MTKLTGTIPTSFAGKPVKGIWDGKCPFDYTLCSLAPSPLNCPNVSFTCSPIGN